MLQLGYLFLVTRRVDGEREVGQKDGLNMDILRKGSTLVVVVLAEGKVGNDFDPGTNHISHGHAVRLDFRTPRSLRIFDLCERPPTRERTI